MQLLTLDFETTYSKTYSLSKMTTEAYINDPQFEVVGVAVKINEEHKSKARDAAISQGVARE